MLKAALSEIKDALYVKEDYIKPDPQIEHILEQCDYFFNEIASVYYIPQNAKMQELYKELAEESDFSEDDFYVPDNNDTRAAIKQIFPSFESCPLENILRTDQPSVMKILPYLLSAYYLNLHKGKDLSAKTQEMLFPGTTNEIVIRDHNYARNVRTYLERFSCQKFLSNFSNAKRSDKSKSIRDLKTENDFSNYLKSGPMSQFHYVQLFKAFVYLSCTAICAQELPESFRSKIDYKDSWNLFEDHTLAFKTVYCIEESSDLFDDTEPFSLYSKAFLSNPTWECLIELHDYYLACVWHLELQEEYLHQILGGKRSSYRLFFQYSIPQAEYRTEQRLYQDYAVMGAAIYNPLVHPHLRTAESLKAHLLRPLRGSSSTTGRYTMPYI